MANFETQIVVIAGGPAGLSAAVQAAEDGAEVILIEKSAAVGGAANMGMGPLQSAPATRRGRCMILPWKKL